MKNAWSEVIDITDELYRSQLDGFPSEQAVIDKLEQSQNQERALLVQALLMIVQLRNQAR